MNPVNELSAAEAAAKCGISKQAVVKACQDGRLKARQVGATDPALPPFCRVWRIREDDLAAWRAQIPDYQLARWPRADRKRKELAPI